MFIKCAISTLETFRFFFSSFVGRHTQRLPRFPGLTPLAEGTARLLYSLQLLSSLFPSVHLTNVQRAYYNAAHSYISHYIWSLEGVLDDISMSRMFLTFQVRFNSAITSCAGPTFVFGIASFRRFLSFTLFYTAIPCLSVGRGFSLSVRTCGAFSVSC